MPNIKRTANRKKPVRNKGKPKDIRDKLRSVEDQEYGMRINIYGRGKTGKTTLACSFPKPLMLIGTMGTLEDGTRSVSDVEGIQFFPLEEVAEIDELVKVLVEDDYKTVVLDTAGGLQDMVLKEHLGLDEVPVQRTWGMADRKDWMLVGAQTKERLRQLMNLSFTNRTNIAIIAHERSFTEDNEDEEALIPKIGSALSPKVAEWLNGSCDYVCQCFIREGVKEKVKKVGKKEVRTKVKTGKGEYCLRIGPHSIFMTGFRKPRSFVLPDTIEDPSYEKILMLSHGEEV